MMPLQQFTVLWQWRYAQAETLEFDDLYIFNTPARDAYGACERLKFHLARTNRYIIKQDVIVLAVFRSSLAGVVERIARSESVHE